MHDNHTIQFVYLHSTFNCIIFFTVISPLHGEMEKTNIYPFQTSIFYSIVYSMKYYEFFHSWEQKGGRHRLAM